MMQQSRHDQKLEFILRTAARIFAEKSYHSTSMRDISRATNVSLAGLYHYCKSKEELLFLIQDNCFGRVLERLEKQLQEVDEPVAKLTVFIENHLSFFAANMAEMKVLSHEAESLRGDLHAHVSTRKDNYTKLARKVLEEVQESTHNKQPVDLTVATYARPSAARSTPCRVRCSQDDCDPRRRRRNATRSGCQRHQGHHAS